MYAALRAVVDAGEQRPPPGTFSTGPPAIVGEPGKYSRAYSCQLLRGKGESAAAAKALAQAMRILRSSFDPLRDLSTGTDLLPIMVEASTFKDQDYSNVYTFLLKDRDQPVCAAVVRVFGRYLAELPFIATQRERRREGHCRVLMDALEALLVSLGVESVCLPAAEVAMGTWVHGFGFDKMPEEQVKAARSDMKVLMFPGTRLLHKEPSARIPPWINLPEISRTASARICRGRAHMNAQPRA